MKINSVNQSFGAKFPNTEGTKKLNYIFDRADLYDQGYCFTNFCNYKTLRKQINKFLLDNDIVYFNNVENIDNPSDVAYKIDGNIIHNGKNKTFETYVYCMEGSFDVGKRIIKSIKKALGIKNTDIF